jgi:putative transposase
MMIAVPPKHAVSQVIGYVKGKSATHLARVHGKRKRNFVGQQFWARGFYVSTVGRGEEAVRKYIREEEEEEKRIDRMGLWCGAPPEVARNPPGRVSVTAQPL